jgi:hypothetical protein
MDSFLYSFYRIRNRGSWPLSSVPSLCSVDSLYTQLKPFTHKPPMITKAEYPLVVDVAPRLTFSRRDSRSLGLSRGLSVRGGGGHMRFSVCPP